MTSARFRDQGSALHKSSLFLQTIRSTADLQMETGAIIGIVVGAVVVALLLFCLCGHLSCWKPKIVYVNRRDSIVHPVSLSELIL
jgi:hypothetical protein